MSSIVAPTTVLTALLFYYGYVATTAEYGYFGISMGSLGLSYRDFLMKSVGALYVPLGTLLLVLLLALWTHAAVRRRLRSRAAAVRWRTAGVLLIAVGAVLLARGITGVAVPEIARSELIATTPICLGLGISAVAYGRYVVTSLTQPSQPRRPRSWTEPASLAVVVALIVLSLFWATNSFAAAYGQGRAQALSERLWNRPAVVLDTPDRLFVAYAGIEEIRLPDADDQQFRYRYRGLRLLVESNNRLFLLPEQWNPRTGAALVIPTEDGVRVQFYRTGR